MQPLFFGNNILHLLPYLKCFFRAGCNSLPAVIVRDSLWGLNRCNSGTDGDSPDERRGRTVVCRYCYDSYICPEVIQGFFLYGNKGSGIYESCQDIGRQRPGMGESQSAGGRCYREG